MKVVAIFLLIFHFTAADFGLSVRIVPLLKTVQTAIGTGIQPLQNASSTANNTVPLGIIRYTDLKDAVTSRIHYLGNITAAIQKANQALLVAVQDSASGPAATFDKLTAVLNGSERQLQSARTAAGHFERNYYGEILTVPVVKLLKDFQGLGEYVATLRVAAVSATKEGTLTTQSVQKYISAAQVKTLGDRVSALMESVRETAQQVQRLNLILQQLTRVCVNYQNGTQHGTILDQSVSQLKTVLKASEGKMIEEIKYSNESIARQYRSFIANHTMGNSSEVINLLNFLNSSVVESFKSLNTTKYFALNETQNSTQRFLTSADKSLNDSYGTIIKALTNPAINSSMINSCVRDYPLSTEDLRVASLFALDCINHLHRATPVSRQVVGRFLDVLDSVVMAPINEYNICTATINNATCLEYFEKHHFLSYYASPAPAASQIVYVMAETVFNNADYAAFRMQRCYEFSGGVYSKLLNDTIKSFTNCLKKV